MLHNCARSAAFFDPLIRKLHSGAALFTEFKLQFAQCLSLVAAKDKLKLEL